MKEKGQILGRKVTLVWVDGAGHRDVLGFSPGGEHAQPQEVRAINGSGTDIRPSTEMTIRPKAKV